MTTTSATGRPKTCWFLALGLWSALGCSGQAPAPVDAPKTEPKAWLDLYGFVMLDSGYDFKTNNPDWFDTMRPTKLPAFNGEFAPDGKVYFGVRQTRFGVNRRPRNPWQTQDPVRIRTLRNRC